MAPDIDKIIPKIESFLDGATKTLDPELLGWLKKYVEMNVAIFAGRPIEDLKVGLVVDTNIALEAIRYYAKDKSSILLRLAKNPIFPMYAPREMAQEVEEKIEIFAAEDGLDRGKMWQAWMILRKVVKLTRARDALAYARAARMMGSRDPDDVAFVQIYIETGAAGILTNDRHYDNPELRTFNLKGLSRMVAMFHRGVYSFYLLHAMLPRFLALLGKMLLAIVREVFKLLSQVAKLAVGAVAGAIQGVASLIEKMPQEAKVALGLGALAAAVIALVMEKSRKKIVSTVESLWAKIKPILRRMAEWFRRAVELIMGFANSSKPYAFVGIAIAAKFYENVRAMTDELMKISAAAA